MNDFEQVAVSTYLSDWPENISYQALLNSLIQGSYLEGDDIVIWEPFENYPSKDIAVFIDDLRKTLERMFSK